MLRSNVTSARKFLSTVNIIPAFLAGCVMAFAATVAKYTQPAFTAALNKRIKSNCEWYDYPATCANNWPSATVFGIAAALVVLFAGAMVTTWLHMQYQRVNSHRLYPNVDATTVARRRAERMFGTFIVLAMLSGIVMIVAVGFAMKR